jgi:Flp pilus assembly protein TadD
MEQPKGVSDADLAAGNIVGLDDLLWRPDGTRRPAKEAARYVGWRSIWVAELRHSILLRLSRPPPFSEPPTVFLSYRWGSEQHNGWVAALAKMLAARGYRVTLDRLVPPEQMDVPAFVSNLADCLYFLAVIDPGYVERLRPGGSGAVKDGWVFDETNNAFDLENLGLLRVVGLLREGTVLPPNFSMPAPGEPGNTIDVRDPTRLANFLDDVFPDRDRGANAARWAAAEGVYNASIEALARGGYQAAFDRAQDLVGREPELIDGYLQEVRVCLAAGAAEPGLAAARHALDRFPEFAEFELAAAEFALALGQSKPAVHHAARVLIAPQVPDERRAKAHAILGTTIDDLGQVDVAIAHLDRAIAHFGRQPLLLQNLGFMQRRAGRPQAAATLFAEALTIEPDSVPLRTNLVAALIESGEAVPARRELKTLADPKAATMLSARIAELEDTGVPVVLSERAPPRAGTVQVACTVCELALVVDDDSVLCFGCGSPRPPGAAPCGFCEADGQVPIILGDAECGCPFCRRGRLRINRLSEPS